MKYAFEMGSGATICIPSFIKIGSGIEKFIGWDTETLITCKGFHLDVVGGPSTPHDPESDAGGSLSSWQGHPSR
jgi:hypothetical protein